MKFAFCLAYICAAVIVVPMPVLGAETSAEWPAQKDKTKPIPGCLVRHLLRIINEMSMIPFHNAPFLHFIQHYAKGQ